MNVPQTGSQPAGDRTPMRNRVTPWGNIVAIEQRGAWLGNRGILHEGTDVVRFHRSDLWIICRLQYRDWRLAQWQPGHFTVLYFYDEAVALAAGHRPCALCRRADYNAFRTALTNRPGEAAAAGQPGLPLAKELDRQLHQERIVRGSHRRRLHPMRWSTLPAGSFIALDGQPGLVLADSVRPWSPQGYRDPLPRPRTGTAEVITPPSTVAALRGGYRPQIDASVLAAG
ncbi:MAG TPA: hypothetical protein VF557_02015 [Jatrophihabitans sp.]|jgi:hypothetical protein|uniref:hypothetical protein n=1 Tax=Jatrophihabitans sp. TaxID=1932789 RepID=UPI002EFE38AB